MKIELGQLAKINQLISEYDELHKKQHEKLSELATEFKKILKEAIIKEDL